MQSTTNTSAFIEAQQYSQFILNNMHDGLLPDQFYRNVSDFPHGTTLNIKVVGSATIRDQEEDVPIQYDPIDTSTVTLSITDYVGDGWYINDVLRQDGNQIDSLHASRGMESTRALQEYFESRFMSVGNSAQTNANPNTINGVAHRIGSSETNNVAALSHFVAMKLAFDKAKVPGAGRVAIVDPVVEATLNGLVTASASVNYNPMFEGIVNEGFERDHKFVRNIMGWDIWTSNRLATGTISDGTTSVSGGVANLFMCVLDDSTKPIMGAWRQMPSVEGERNKDMARDEFVTRARFGFGAQRTQSLGVLGTSATSY
jgi:hypothetical protein